MRRFHEDNLQEGRRSANLQHLGTQAIKKLVGPIEDHFVFRRCCFVISCFTSRTLLSFLALSTLPGGPMYYCVPRCFLFAMYPG